VAPVGEPRVLQADATAAVEVDSDRHRQRAPDAHIPDVADPDARAPAGAPAAAGGSSAGR
jgi:hypothetical protein